MKSAYPKTIKIAILGGTLVALSTYVIVAFVVLAVPWQLQVISEGGHRDSLKYDHHHHHD